MDFTEKYNLYKGVAEKYFNREFFEKLSKSATDEGIKYSFFGNGKRIRPVISLAFSDYLGLSREEVLPFSLAIECVHVHSLIHDDLPALDNDDFRRGKPCLHKVYGEDVAILSGDALLNYAYLTCLKHCETKESILALEVLSENTNKMLLGQSLDTSFCENWEKEKVLEVYKNKTSALITAAMIIPAVLKGRKDLYTDLSELGKNLGLLFQITDDLIDYGKNSKQKKPENELNFVRMFGVETALEHKLTFLNQCIKIANKFDDFEFLKLFIDFVSERSF